MNIWQLEDLREALTNLGHTYTVITDENIYNHVDEAFDARFDKLIESASYDAVFTFNYFPVISNCCKKHNIPYIAFVYDSPLVSLYSYTIINPCNYVFLFDQQTYLELKKENIQTVYYMPLAVNTSRLDKMTVSAVSASRHPLDFTRAIFLLSVLCIMKSTTCLTAWSIYLITQKAIYRGLCRRR